MHAITCDDYLTVANRDADYDYYHGPHYVTIPAGDTRTSFNLPIYDDNRVERNEHFHLFINGASLPQYVITSSLDSATVTIVDDDCKYK